MAKEVLKTTLRKGKPRASRNVTVTDADRHKLLQLALEKTQEAKSRPRPSPMEPTSKVLNDLVGFLIETDPEARPEHIVEGAMTALRSGILGGNFVAPADATVLAYVKRKLKELETDDAVNLAITIPHAEPAARPAKPECSAEALLRGRQSGPPPESCALDDVPF